MRDSVQNCEAIPSTLQEQAHLDPLPDRPKIPHKFAMKNDQQAPSETSDQIDQNIEKVLAFYQREERKLGTSQRIVESASKIIGRPLFLAFILALVTFWVVANVVLQIAGWREFDAPPFAALQGIVGLSSLITTTVVLITQNRIAKVEEQRAHLELQINLLSEQKMAKLINLIEELRRDLPMVKNRHDARAAAFQQPTDTDQVLSALDEKLSPEGSHAPDAAPEADSKATPEQ